jgi:hypothetical protein
MILNFKNIYDDLYRIETKKKINYKFDLFLKKYRTFFFKF